MGIPGLIVFLLFLFTLFKYGIKKLVKSEDKYINTVSADNNHLLDTGFLYFNFSKNPRRKKGDFLTKENLYEFS